MSDFVSKSGDFSEAQESMRRLALAAAIAQPVTREPAFAELRVGTFDAFASRRFVLAVAAAHLTLSVIADIFLT